MVETVQSLRQKKFKVRVGHRRFYRGQGMGEPLFRTQIICDGLYQSPLPRGGETVVSVLTPEGEELMGTAKCSKKDPYNKRRGVLIALGRALTSLKMEEPHG